jgi:hypothetical protein
MHATKPATIGVALDDSPVALAACFPAAAEPQLPAERLRAAFKPYRG